MLSLQRLLAEHAVRFQTTLPASLARGSAAFIDATDEVKHADFMTARLGATIRSRLLLRRIPGFARAGGGPTGATPKKK